MTLSEIKTTLGEIGMSPTRSLGQNFLHDQNLDDWIIAQLSECTASSVELLAGRPAQPRPDRGAIVCACFDVGAKTIVAAALGGATTLEAIGQATCAGTNCGSCRPAIAGLLAASPTREAEAAE